MIRGYIKGYCITNLDDYKICEWPKKFVAVPRKGERISSKESVYKSLKVVQITHTVNVDNEPIIVVELNK